MNVLFLGQVVAAVLFLVAVAFVGALAWIRTPRLDMIFDPTDQTCTHITQDAKGRKDRMYRVAIINHSSRTIEGVGVFITEHTNQGSAILLQRLAFKDERFREQRSENYEQLSKINPGRRYVDVVSHPDATNDYPIVMQVALTDIPKPLEAGPHILTLVAKASNAPEQTRQFQIDTDGEFGALTFKPYHAVSRYTLRVFGREFFIGKIGLV